MVLLAVTLIEARRAIDSDERRGVNGWEGGRGTGDGVRVA
jgi:hypothetical protein